jgi:hypothetical protein
MRAADVDSFELGSRVRKKNGLSFGTNLVRLPTNPCWIVCGQELEPRGRRIHLNRSAIQEWDSGDSSGPFPFGRILSLFK